MSRTRGIAEGIPVSRRGFRKENQGDQNLDLQYLLTMQGPGLTQTADSEPQSIFPTDPRGTQQ